MVFLGSSKTDKAGRITLIKEVKEVLELSEKDHVMFYLEDGEVVIRKYIDLPPDMVASMNNFQDWVRKKRIEIDLMDDQAIKDIETEKLNERIEQVKECEEAIRGLSQMP